MAFSLIASVGAGAVDGVHVTTGNIDTTGATSLFAWVGTPIGQPVPTVNDSKSNAWVLWAQYAVTEQRISLYVATGSITVGTGHNFSTSANQSPSIKVEAWAHSNNLSLPDFLTTKARAGTSIQAGNIVPSQDNSLVLTGLVYGTAVISGLSVDSGFAGSPGDVALVAGGHYGVASAYVIETSIVAKNPTWSWTTSVNACVIQFSVYESTTPYGRASAAPLLVLANDFPPARISSGGLLVLTDERPPVRVSSAPLLVLSQGVGIPVEYEDPCAITEPRIYVIIRNEVFTP